MTRFTRPLAGVVTLALSTAGLAVFAATPASAANLGSVTVNPTSGNQDTLFGGSATTACPSGTVDSFWDIFGNDIGVGAPAGSGDIGYLGAGNSTGTGPQSFSGASIANLKSTNSGSFATNGAYLIRFNCVNAGGTTTDTYSTTMNYTTANNGAWTIQAPARATSTVLSGTPASPIETGTPIDLTADVTPTSGADDATGSVEFFDGATSLGIDSTLSPTGVANLNSVSLAEGSHSLTAVYTPADTATHTGSTSNALSYQVNAVAARPTSSVLTVSPTTGAEYQTVTFNCAVSASQGTPVGSVQFKDGSTVLATVALASGAATYVANNFAAGAHSFTCFYPGQAPYSASTSNTVAATYDASAGTPATPDEQTITVVIPAGALTITTPYTPTNPLALGTAVLDPNTSTFSASKPFDKVTINDTRTGQFGFSARLVAGAFSNGATSFGGDRAGFVNVVAVQVPGNAMQASDVQTFNNPAVTNGGLGTSKEFARYPSNKPLGSVDVKADFEVKQIPTSITPGTYTSTVTFTAV